MSCIIFLDPLGSKLMGKHIWIQNLNIYENPILSPYSFCVKFVVFQQENYFKNKQHFFVWTVIKNLTDTKCYPCIEATFVCVRILVSPFLKVCCFLLKTLEVLTENLRNVTFCVKIWKIDQKKKKALHFWLGVWPGQAVTMNLKPVRSDK